MRLEWENHFYKGKRAGEIIPLNPLKEMKIEFIKENKPKDEIKSGWGCSGFYGEKIRCKKCGEPAEENFDYASMTTGRKLRCVNCNVELWIDETTQLCDPKKYQHFNECFELTPLPSKK